MKRSHGVLKSVNLTPNGTSYHRNCALMLSLDGTFIVIFLSFLVFVVLMKGVFFTPIAQSEAISRTRRPGLIAGKRVAKDDSAARASCERGGSPVQLATGRRRVQKAHHLIQEKRELGQGHRRRNALPRPVAGRMPNTTPNWRSCGLRRTAPMTPWRPIGKHWPG